MKVAVHPFDDLPTWNITYPTYFEIVEDGLLPFCDLIGVENEERWQILEAIIAPVHGTISLQNLTSQTKKSAAEIVVSRQNVTAFGTSADINALLKNIIYTPKADWHGRDQVNFAVKDGPERTFTEAEITIHVAPINDAPGV